MSGIYNCLRVFWCAAARMSQFELKQRTNIKFLVKLGKNGNEIREMLVHIYEDNALKKTAVYKWVKRFSEGRENFTDEESSGRSKTSRSEENIAKICQIVLGNRRRTIRSIAERANTDKETVRKILTEDLDMRKVYAKNGPKAPAHTALSVKEFLATKQITVLEHPAYSPNLAPMTFFCSRR